MENNNILFEANNLRTYLRLYLRDLCNGVIYPNEQHNESIQYFQDDEMHSITQMIADINNFIKTKRSNEATYAFLYRLESNNNPITDNHEIDMSSILAEAMTFKSHLEIYLESLKSGKIYPSSHHGFNSSNMIFKELETNERAIVTALNDSSQHFINVKKFNNASYNFLLEKQNNTQSM